jgi:general secretion pathway protein L
MSMLVIQLPPRARGGEAPPEPAAALAHVLSSDGLGVSAQGRGLPQPWPKADSVVAVVPATEVGWHRTTVPKAPAGRLRAALAGLLEEHLLDDDADVHLALAPGAKAGDEAWVAAMDRAWLSGWISTIEAQGATLDRVVPALAPASSEANAAGHGHVFGAAAAEDASDGAAPWLAVADTTGVTTMRLSGGLARARQAAWIEQGLRWTAEPASVGLAERWLGAPVQVQTEAELALAAARSPWNLRQFDLAPRHRGLRALRELAKQWRGPAWRPARWGLAAALVLQVLGLNLWAWQQQRQVAARKDEMNALLRSAHPQVRAILDAPVQMQRETDLLRQSAGRVGAGDFEPLLALAARGWPDGQPPVQNLRYEPGRLTLAAPGWTPEQVQAFRSRVEPAGGQVENSDGRVILSIAR